MPYLGLSPAPERDNDRTGWEGIRSQAGGFTTVDFCTVAVWTWSASTAYYVLAFMRLNADSLEKNLP